MRNCQRIATLALLAFQASMACAQANVSAKPARTRIAEIQFAGLRQLTISDFDDINRRYQGRVSASSDWEQTLSGLAERTQDVYQRKGYFKATVNAVIEIVSADGDQRDVRVVLKMEEGRQYRLKEVLWTGNKVFSVAELQATIPMAPDEIFNTAKVRKGLENLRKLYGQRGYINFTPVPDTKIDDNAQTVTLAMDLDEGKQFRIAKVEFLGLSTDDREKLLNDWNLSPGSPYDSFYIEKFFWDHKNLLPPGAHPDADIEVIRNESGGTVDVIFDFSNKDLTFAGDEKY